MGNTCARHLAGLEWWDTGPRPELFGAISVHDLLSVGTGLF